MCAHGLGLNGGALGLCVFNMILHREKPAVSQVAYNHSISL